MSEAPIPSRDRRLLRWIIAASIIAIAIVVSVVLILRAIPDEATAQVEIAGWKVPVGVTVSTDSARAHLPALVVGTLLGDKPTIQVNAGHVTSVTADKLSITPLTGGKDATYALTGSTKEFNIRQPLLSADPKPGDSVAVITAPGSDTALLVLTNVTLSK